MPHFVVFSVVPVQYMQRIFADYLQIRDLIPEGAVGLFRGDWSNCRHAPIMAASRSPYVHAGLLSWRTPKGNPPRLELLDTIQRVGARRIPFLSREVRKYPNQWDVFEVTDPAYNGRAATNAMRRREAEKYPYGWGAFRAAARLHYPVLRWFMPGDLEEDEDSLRFQMCSGAVSQDMREAGGVDPAPGLKDRYTAPGDLLRGGVLKYLCTPVWTRRVERRESSVERRETKADEAASAMAMMDTLFAACGHPPVTWITEPEPSNS